MKYSIDKKEKYSILKLQEDKLNSIISPDLKSELVKLNAEGIKNIILDLSEVKYADSSGLSCILTGNRLCETASGIFILCCLNDHVLKLLKISQLDTVLNVLPSLEESIDAVFMNELEKDFREEEDSE